MRRKFHICVPVYNAECWLPEALDSACNQTLQDIEIICVDDGSTDGSLAILKSYAEKDPRITILENDCNRGTHHSRLRAIRASRGDYILWLDADDELLLPIAELALEKANSSRADVVVFRARHGQQTSSHPVAIERKTQSGAHFLELAADRAVSWTLWDKLWRGNMRREVAEELWPSAQSHHLVKAEDLLLFWFAARRCDSYAVLPQPGYHYIHNRGQEVQRRHNPAFQRKFVRDVCAVHGKIFAEAEEWK
ncbi:MAG: glycosyltransferase, partial [Puniceicoccales bacterium]|nr:glycosyltransferase [Puniceicoccales bacterium]